MEYIHKISFLALACFVLLSTGTACLAYQNPTANAGPDLYLTSGQTTTLQGYGYDPNGFFLNYYWTCNGGSLSNNYIAQPTYTAPYAINGNNQAIYTCTLTTTNTYGWSASDSTTIYANYNNGNYYNGTFSVSKKVINLTKGNLVWQSFVSADPSDVLSFAVTLQANGQDIHNVIVRDALPANLIYLGNLTVNTNSNYGGNITSGVNIGTVYANQPIVVAYQAQVAPAGNFAFGATTLNNSATITSSEISSQTTNASVLVNRSLVYGASTVSTGLTNNLLTDSFFLPFLVIVAGLWLYFSGNAYKFASRLKANREK